jgi:hypothetical protein
MTATLLEKFFIAVTPLYSALLFYASYTAVVGALMIVILLQSAGWL